MRNYREKKKLWKERIIEEIEELEEKTQINYRGKNKKLQGKKKLHEKRNYGKKKLYKK